MAFKQSEVGEITALEHSSLKENKKNIIEDLVEQFSKFQLDENGKCINFDVKATKTSVSMLQEVLSRQGIFPSYELLQTNGTVNVPVYCYRVSFTEKGKTYEAIGSAFSKKEARKAAARALIQNLFGGTIPNNPWTADIEKEPDPGENPVCRLQRFCKEKHWPPPIYETERETVSATGKILTMACSVLTFRELGEGRNKKLAKRSAAEHIWKRLMDNPAEQEKAGKEFLLFLQISESKERNALWTPDSLSMRKGKKLRKLQKICLMDHAIDSKELLQEIGSENNFKITYIDIEETAIDNRYQCLVQLSITPVGICHGTADTREQAQRKAALNALEYLKIITKN